GNKHENRDDYSQGLFLGYSHDISDSSQLSLHIAQDIYSPSGSNKRHNTAVTGDRAFSAYTHTGIEWNSLANDWIRYRLGTDIGVVGPDAGGQKVQNKAHEIIGAEKYHAWDDQIENRYGYTVKGMLSMTP
ncbi:lipid A-modifier LpxR family protein, partial [Escherichia coli]